MKQVKKKKNRKKGLYIACGCLLLAAAVGTAVYFITASIHSNTTEKESEEGLETVYAEYGEDIESVLSEKLQGQDFSADVSGFSYEEGKDYPALGTYEIALTLYTDDTDKEETITVEVLDTTPPVIETSSVEINLAAEKSDIVDQIQVSDLSSITLELDDSNVEYGTAGTYTAIASAKDASGNQSEQDVEVIIGGPEIVESSDGSPTLINGIPVVNKQHGLAANYAPGEDPEAKAALLQLIADAQAQGLDISNAYSGFRSYEYQGQLYNGYVSVYGQAYADTISARPGYSEHQTGLAYDLKHSSGALVENAAEAQWIAENAYKYGFIVRYMAGKEDITGYSYEPWHIRYIGEEAQKIYESGLCLEEYLGIEGGTVYVEYGS